MYLQINLIGFMLILFVGICKINGQVYPKPCPIPPSESSFYKVNSTKLNPSIQSSLPVIEEKFIYNSKPVVKNNKEDINNYKPETLLHHFIIQNV